MFCVKRELKLSCLSNCVMVINILIQGSFLFEIKPFRSSHMTLTFLRLLFFRENKLFLIICKQSSLLKTYDIYLQCTYSCLKNTNFVFLSTNKDDRNRFLHLIFVQSSETKIQTLVYRHCKYILSLNHDWYQANLNLPWIFRMHYSLLWKFLSGRYPSFFNDLTGISSSQLKGLRFQGIL